MSHASAAELAFDAAAKALTAARARLGRSKSNATRLAYQDASDAYDAALAIYVSEQDAAQQADDAAARDDLRARRLAFVASRRTLLARQFSLSL